jgi:hypothetical protein
VAATLCSPLNAVAADIVPQFQPREDWHGAYLCGGRHSVATLKVKEVTATGAQTSRFVGTFDFNDLRGRSGYYGVEGRVEPNGTLVNVVPRGVIVLPAGFIALAFQGRLDGDIVFQGRMTLPGCDALVLVRPSASSPAELVPEAVQRDDPGLEKDELIVRPVTERFRFLDRAVTTVLKLPCEPRVEVLRRLSLEPNPTDSRRDELAVALAMMESRRECGVQPSALSRSAQLHVRPTLVAWRRSIDNPDRREPPAYNPADRPWIMAALPDRSPALTEPSANAEECRAPDQVFANQPAREAFARTFEGRSLLRVVWDWGQARYGARIICKTTSADGHTEESRVRWQALIRAWRTATTADEGPWLTTKDAAQLSILLSAARSLDQQVQRDEEIKRIRRAAEEADQLERRRGIQEQDRR